MDVSQQLRDVLSDRYRIEREIGAGGMATVYLAEDLRHRRRVALKVLRPELGAVLGPDRFLSEINVTANLQHPHLLPLFDSGEAEGLLFYVMPYIEGESLRARLERERQLPVDEAIRIAVSIASALDYAHRHGVIHRDLKPENILLHDGQPLVTDFGIALAVSNAGGMRVTQTGLSLGTPQYMSPEQATGDRVIDARSDVYSLAAVLYEMLTGDPPHLAGTTQAIVAKVLTEKPPSVRVYRDSVPEHVDGAIQRALAKLPADRFATAGEFSEALTGARVVLAPTSAAVVARSALRNYLPWAAVALLALSGAIAAGTMSRAPAGTPMLMRIELPEGFEPESPTGTTLALSPDGTQLVLLGDASEGQGAIMRPMASIDARLISGTGRARTPFFSPDGRRLGFMSTRMLYTVSLEGGVPVAITDTTSLTNPSWTDAGFIIGGYGNRLFRVPQGGGEVETIAAIDSARGHVRYGHVHALPGGRNALLTIWKDGIAIENAQVGVIDLESGAVEELGIAGANPRYLRGGYIIFARAGGTVHGARFSLRRLRVTSPIVPLLQNVVVKGGGAMALTTADNGTIVYKPGFSGDVLQLVLVARDGQATPVGSPQAYRYPRVSANGRRVAVQIVDAESRDIWTQDLVAGTLMRVTTDGASERPSWTHDGQRIAFMHGDDASRALLARSWDGTGKADTILALPGYAVGDAAFGPPSTFNVFKIGPVGNIWDVWLAPATEPVVAEPFIQTASQESDPALSPDGRLLAYTSNESGRNEVYVRPVPGPGNRIQVSIDGGGEPVWSRNSRELFYRSDDQVIAAMIARDPELDVLGRDTLFEAPYVRDALRANYDVLPDGRFVFLMNPTSAPTQVLHVLANATDELRMRIQRAGTAAKQ